MTLDWSRAKVLSLTEFEVCWGLLRLGETPWQLDPPHLGCTDEERHRIVTDTVNGLQERGVGDARGPRPHLAEQLRLLADPESGLDVRFRDRSLTAAFAAQRGPHATLAVRHRGEIAVLEIPPAAAALALAELISPVHPGHGFRVQLPADVLDAARAAAPDDPERFAIELRRHGIHASVAHGLVQMCTGIDQHGQFGATARSRSGRPLRAPYVVGIHRTPSGHFAQLRRRTADGRAVVTVEPMSQQTLLRHLDELTDSRLEPAR